MNGTIRVINLTMQPQYQQDQDLKPPFARDQAVSIGHDTLLKNVFNDGGLQEIQRNYFNHLSHQMNSDDGHHLIALINRMARLVKAGTDLVLLSGQPPESCHGVVVKHFIEQAIDKLPLEVPPQEALQDPTPVPQQPAGTQVSPLDPTDSLDLPQPEPQMETEQAVAAGQENLQSKETSGATVPESSDESPMEEPSTEDEVQGDTPTDEADSQDEASGDETGDSPPADSTEDEPEERDVPSQFFQQLKATLKVGQTAVMMVQHQADGELMVTFGIQVDEHNPQAEASPTVGITLSAAELDDPDEGFLAGLKDFRQERKTALAAFKAAASAIKTPPATGSKGSKVQTSKKQTTQGAKTAPVANAGNSKPAEPIQAPEAQAQGALFASN